MLFWEAQDFKRFGFRVLGFRVVHRIMQDSSTTVAFDAPAWWDYYTFSWVQDLGV